MAPRLGNRVEGGTVPEMGTSAGKVGLYRKCFRLSLDRLTGGGWARRHPRQETRLTTEYMILELELRKDLDQRERFAIF